MDFNLSKQNSLQQKKRIMFIFIYIESHLSSSAGQDCGSCGYFTLNFDPASVKYLLRNASVLLRFIAFCKLFIVWISTKDYCFLATTPYKIF